jgi:AmmeMemoRadiSam system protein B
MARKPVVAGMFYPFGKDALKQNLSKLFAGVKKGDFVCVVSPHAGYQYSGKTAAFAIGSLRASKTFIILGPNHNVIGNEFAIMSSGAWETPLGGVEIDSMLAGLLSKCEVLVEDDLAHAHEHSIEVQLPFLQYRFGSFKFVPLSITNVDYSEEFLKKCESLGRHIAKKIKGKGIGVVASSDFSHYLPAKVAASKDTRAIDEIKQLNPAGFFRSLEENNASVCGYGPIAVVMYIAKHLGIKAAEVISHSNSGDETGDYSSVVSYYAIGFR